MCQSSSSGSFQNYSCLSCRQRKVRCDRYIPCTNCTKAKTHCNFAPPVRGKRKRTKPPRESLHAKLKRYEELLKTHGIDPEGSAKLEDSSSNPETLGMEVASLSDCSEAEMRPKLVTKEGISRYFDRVPWSTLGNQHPEVGNSGDELVQDSGFILNQENEDVENFTPIDLPHEISTRLCEIYADRVDPLIKILHLPIFWKEITKSLSDRSKSLETLRLAVYFSAVSSMKEDECQDLLGAQKSFMYTIYKRAARQALENVRLLSTSNPVNLQAYAIFMMCIRKTCGNDTLFILSGVAIRLARKMGLHRDGTMLSLSPFETEMRRRLWWHLVYVDLRIADVLGAKPSSDLSFCDAKMPLNVEDEDLRPEMTESPNERAGITAMSFCLVKYEIMASLRDLSAASPGDGEWKILLQPNVPVIRQDSIINQIEDRLENRYLRYCDPVNSFHTFISIMIRSSICRLRLLIYIPSQFASHRKNVPNHERDIVFTSATKFLRYVTIVQKGIHGLEKYRWQIGPSALWNAMLYLLIEIRHRGTGPEVERAWKLIEDAFALHTWAFESPTGTVYGVLGRWTVEAWDNYVTVLREKGLPEPLTPGYISDIRLKTGNLAGRAGDLLMDTGSEIERPVGSTPQQDISDPNSSFEFPDLLSFEIDPNEWIQWEQLVVEQSSFAQIDSMHL